MISVFVYIRCLSAIFFSNPLADFLVISLAHAIDSIISLLRYLDNDNLNSFVVCTSTILPICREIDGINGKGFPEKKPSRFLDFQFPGRKRNTMSVCSCSVRYDAQVHISKPRKNITNDVNVITAASNLITFQRLYYYLDT